MTIVQAARDKYVLMNARCLSSPSRPPPLKLGQYNHKNMVPVKGELASRLYNCHYIDTYCSTHVILIRTSVIT